MVDIVSINLADQPGGEVCAAEVDEKVPLPVRHGEEVRHAAQVRFQQAGTTPDGHHPPGRGTNIWVLLGYLEDLAMHVARTLEGFGA